MTRNFGQVVAQITKTSRNNAHPSLAFKMQTISIGGGELIVTYFSIAYFLCVFHGGIC
jgi:hypothetical protein